MQPNLLIIEEVIGEVFKRISFNLKEENPDEALTEALKLTAALAHLVFAYHNLFSITDRHQKLGLALTEVSKMMEVEWNETMDLLNAPMPSSTLN